jgi:Second Messenger Oligonucleotide or Dinucleotide Synthetase domain
MPSTIADAFEQLRSTLETTTPPAETVSVRQDLVRAVLQKKMMISRDFIGGSYARSTMIAPMKDADIDLFAVVDAYYYHRIEDKKRGGQSGLLRDVRWALRAAYKGPVISHDGHAVTVQFEDFRISVMPVVHRIDGGYMIPDSRTQQWISTNPKRHDEILAEADEAHQRMLVPLIRMLKAWNRYRGSFFTSFHLEVLALNALRDVTITDFPSAVRIFFDRARAVVADITLDPAGYGNDVGKYLRSPAKAAEAQRRLEDAYSVAVQADEKGTAREHTALELWRRLFPTVFPR